jgi:hypothetical protein
MSDIYIERLQRMLDEKDRQLQALRNSVEIYAKERSDLVECLKYFVSNKYEMPLEKAIERSKAVLKGKNLWDTKMGERQ